MDSPAILAESCKIFYVLFYVMVLGVEPWAPCMPARCPALVASSLGKHCPLHSHLVPPFFPSLTPSSVCLGTIYWPPGPCHVWWPTPLLSVKQTPWPLPRLSEVQVPTSTIVSSLVGRKQLSFPWVTEGAGLSPSCMGESPGNLKTGQCPSSYQPKSGRTSGSQTTHWHVWKDPPQGLGM